MDQQISQTLWLPPGTCVLNALSAYAHQTLPTISAYQPTAHQVLKQQQQQQLFPQTITASSLIPNPTLLQHNLLSPSQGFIQVPAFENLMMTPGGKQVFEVPAYPPTSVLHGLPYTMPSTTVLPADLMTSQRIDFIGSKIAKKKRISPSAKRRSRMRLMAFLEAKKKQQEQDGSLSESSATPTSSADAEDNLTSCADINATEDDVVIPELNAK